MLKFLTLLFIVPVICFSPVLSIFAIILTITLIIWQVFCKMTYKEMNTNETAAIVRALITARGADGATLDYLKADYKQQVGQNLSYGNSDVALLQWLGSLQDVRTQWIAGKVVYFSEAPSQQHLVRMIGRQKHDRKKRRGTRRVKSQQSNWFEISQSFNDATQTTPKTWANSLVFRRSKQSRLFQSHEFVGHDTSVYTPNQHIVNEAPPEAPKLPALQDSNHGLVDRSYNAGLYDQQCVNDPDYDQHSNPSNGSHYMDLTSFSFVSHIGEPDVKADPNIPEFYKCLLVGDNFFLNLAVMELGYRMLNHGRVLQSGFCVSGQTIAEATRNIRNIAPNQLILLNIGSTDIAQNRELVDMIFGMIRLLKTCVKYGISPILTTVMPLANYRLGNRIGVTNGFNEFLVKNPFNFPVIELHKLFLNDHGSIQPHFYQAAPRHVSGMRKPVVFWTRFGRQKVLKTLTQELGSAILKILFK